MSRVRYVVNDLPLQGAGAFTPFGGTNPIASSWGLVHVVGAPGTLDVATDNPTKSWAGISPAHAKVQGSNVVPNEIHPALYVASARNMGPGAPNGTAHIGMRTRRHTPMPIPALSWISTAKRAMRQPKIGGRSVVNNPRAWQRWPNRNGSAT